MPSTPRIRPSLSALRLASIYGLAAGAWIVLSDRVNHRLFGNTSQFTAISQYKGLFFVAVTALLLYFVLKRRLLFIERSQQALSESERRFAAFMDNIPVAAFIRDRDGRYIYANPYWIQHFSRGKEWHGARPDRFFHPEFVACADEDHQRILSGEPVVERVLRLDTSIGEREWIIRRFPIQIGSTTETLVGAFALDVTDRRQLEEQLRQAAKMEAIGLLAGGIAHDFNNLLTVIGGYAQMLDRWAADPAAITRAAAEIRKASDSGALLTGQLLAFSRKQVHQLKPTSLNAVVQNSSSLLQRLIGENFEFQLSLSPTPVSVLADPNQIEQVLLNLTVNARDAMPAGGAIRVSTSLVTLPDPADAARLGLTPGPYGLLSVADEGHGIDPQIQSRIFEPFFTTKGRAKGTGLGLSTVYGIVQHSGGAIAVHSQPGDGSLFEIYLPAAESHPEPEPAPAGAALPSSPHESILLVEDEPAVRSVISQMLQTLGYRVLEASSGPEALDLLHADSAPVDLVISDVSMPGWQGTEVLRRLREVQPGLKAILITGYSEEVAQAPPDLNEARILHKPFTFQSLDRALRQTLDPPAS